MATLLELTQIQQADGFDELSAKVRAAAVKKAVAIIGEDSPSAERLDWARSTLMNADQAGEDVLWYAIGTAADSTQQEILDATDADIEAAVGNAIDALHA